MTKGHPYGYKLSRIVSNIHVIYRMYSVANTKYYNLLVHEKCKKTMEIY